MGRGEDTGNRRTEVEPAKARWAKARFPHSGHNRLTYEHLPLPAGLRHLVGTAHLVQAHTPQDEDDDAGATPVLPRSLVLVPVPIASAAYRKKRNSVACNP